MADRLELRCSSSPTRDLSNGIDRFSDIVVRAVVDENASAVLAELSPPHGGPRIADQFYLVASLALVAIAVFIPRVGSRVLLAGILLVFGSFLSACRHPH